jgi:predicted nucleic acid-binding protein
MRVVPDTNILVRANAKAKGPARELLQVIVNSPEHVLLLSPFLLMELERVLSYDRVRAVVKLNDEEIAEYLGYCQQRGVLAGTDAEMLDFLRSQGPPTVS